MIDKEMELGYTPKNLRKLREMYNLKQTDVARICEMSQPVSVTRWEAEADKKNHASMPHEKWLKLLDYIKEIDNNKLTLLKKEYALLNAQANPNRAHELLVEMLHAAGQADIAELVSSKKIIE